MTRVTPAAAATPLVDSMRVGAQIGLRHLFFKLESCQPSGSYKDRFVSAQLDVVARRLNESNSRGASGSICLATSSGNTGAALAAGCARYGFTCRIFVSPDVPEGKLQQMQAHGAQVFRVSGFTIAPEVTARVWRDLDELSRRTGMPLIVSAYRVCAEGMAGVETLAAELREQAGPALRHIFVPVGGGGLFTAISRGVAALEPPRPLVHAVQPAGCDTLVGPFLAGADAARSVESTTRISGLSVPFDIDATTALGELRRGGGLAIRVSDEEVFAAQRLLLQEEGIWAEPAGATAFAGCLRALRDGRLSAGEPVVCLVTGHGFKDPASAALMAARTPAHAIDPDAVAAAALEGVA